MESLTAKLNQAQEDSKEEKAILALLTDKNKEYELELERIPLLIAQVSLIHYILVAVSLRFI